MKTAVAFPSLMYVATCQNFHRPRDLGSEFETYWKFNSLPTYINKCPTRYNNMQSIFYCNITLLVSSAVRTHYQEYIKTVVTATGTRHMVVQLPHSKVAKFGYDGVRKMHEHMTCTSGCNYSFM